MAIPEDVPQIVLVDCAAIKYADRQRTDIGNIPELAQSIQEIGLLNPIIVEDDFTLRAGGRRLMAFIYLGRTQIPARLWGTLTDIEKVQIELEENIKRKNLNWFEESAAKQKLHQLLLLKHPQPIPTAKHDGPGQPPKAWGLKDTAQILGQGISTLSQDITLVEAAQIIPEIKKQASKTNAMRILRKTFELATLVEKQSRQARIGGNASKSRVEIGDCTVELKRLEDQSVDLILTDPPWGIDIDSTAREWVRMHRTFDDSVKSSIEKTQIALQEGFRILRDGSHLYLFCTWSLMQFWQEELERFGFWVRPAPIVWVKGNVTAGQPYWKFMSKTECIIFAHKGQGGRILTAPASDVLQYDAPRKRIHPNEKPVELLRYLITISTVEGEIVVDPFAGSGSTVRAAILTNRVGIGFENDPVVAKAAQGNILSLGDPQNAQSQTDLTATP